MNIGKLINAVHKFYDAYYQIIWNLGWDEFEKIKPELEKMKEVFDKSIKGDY